ncbi:pyridoxal 5'-phosphate synthase-like subunit pdx1.2 [Quercus suber]|uniref:Pyridoxal 5'-phosphate synthase-like subunit pdx1.2 n=1 Tax=Quercus suber TaxID=58331 RepID=A0AAW0JFM2_QUESU
MNEVDTKHRERKEKREREKKNCTKIAEHAKIAEQAGACCLIVSDPSQQGISRMPNLFLIKEIKRVVSIPLMVRARVGHFFEAQFLEAIGVDYIDERRISSIALANEDNFIPLLLLHLWTISIPLLLLQMRTIS